MDTAALTPFSQKR